jgi:murein DD-endopeptidase MepM/ murein hydrolase activator NlpD
MKKTLSSPLVAAANNIVSLGSRSNSLTRFQRDFNGFSKFLEVEKRSLEKLKLPDKKKIKALASLNIASNFGRPGNLLGSLFSGALDLAGFVGNMFPGRGKLGKPQRPSNVRPPKPTIKGPRLKLGGMRAVGVGNALFAGLDFATGLAEGESVGKAAAGAGGALAGGLLGGVIGQTLIPIPGLGFVIGNMAGSFLGGFAADRVYEGGSALKQKLAERLKGQEGKQKGIASGLAFKDTIDKFDAAVNRFEKGVVMGMFGTMGQSETQPMEDVTGSVETSYEIEPGEQPTEPGATYSAEGGDKPSSNFTSSFGWRWGKQHSGVDFASPSASAPVSVIQPGIIDTSYESGYGNWVAVKHDNGAETFYGHLSKVEVKKGQRIEAGTVIGNQGNTGRSKGAHVHFEYRPGGPGTNAVDGRGVADSYFRFGGNIKVKKGEMKDMKTDANKKLGEVSTDYQQEKRKAQQVAPTPQSQVAASSQMMQVPQMSSMVAAAPMNLPVAPQNIQYYTSYNQPGGGSSVIMPIMMGGGGGGQQRPVYIPVGGGGGGGTVIMPGPTEGQVVNSLMKTMLLTNLSAT